MHSTPPSLMRRALLALLLTIGFYGLALGIVALLLFIVYAQIRFAHRINARLTLSCLISAGAILWAILPRLDRFEPPGPHLEPEKHPRLFDEVSDIAQKVNQKMPGEIYLIPYVNAFVMERGGFMGIGSRRVMGVGLPLLHTLTIAQFRAIVAHEFGHFYGGDTKLGPWIYKTRMAIIRTIQGLGQKSWLQAPFRWYGLMFLRTTHTLSRRQELVADELAARTTGARPFIEGLRTIHRTAPVFDAFWRSEFAPVIKAGYRPLLTEGFAHFISTPSVAKAMEQAIEREMDSSETDPYDTHPSLKERIAAVQALLLGSDVGDDTPALPLLNDVPELEQKLLAYLFGEGQAGAWKPVGWQEVGTAVWLPFWEKTIREYVTTLKGVTPASLPEFLRSPDRLATQLQQSAGKSLTQEEVARGVLSILAMALAVALARQGWSLDAMPGAEVSLRQGNNVIKPFAALAELASSRLAVETWQQRCEQAGIANLDLGHVIMP